MATAERLVRALPGNSSRARRALSNYPHARLYAKGRDDLNDGVAKPPGHSLDYLGEQSGRESMVLLG